MSTLLLSFTLSIAISIIVTPIVRALALRWGVVDIPDGVPPSAGRKQHARPTPLLGGIAVYVAFAVSVGVIAWVTLAPFQGRINPLALGAVLVGGLVLTIGGALDDRYHLRPAQQFVFPLAAALLAAAAGVGISQVTNPSGGPAIPLAPVMTVAFTIVWLLGTTYTTKLLDGLDGLVAGITAIGALLITALSLTARYYQPDIAVLSLALAGATLGFLLWNFHPARIFLGEGGSTLCGYLLGVLAIIAGGKIATALLVLGIPAVDVALVLGQRLVATGKPFASDRRHLHFRLLTLGCSHRNAVLVLYAIAGGFGALTLVLQAQGKLVALGVLVGIAITLSSIAVLRHRTMRRAPAGLPQEPQTRSS